MPDQILENSVNPTEQWLPDIDELFEAVEADFRTQRPEAYSPQYAPTAGPELINVDPEASYLQAAAVLKSFDIETLQPYSVLWDEFPSTKSAPEEDAQLRLLSCSTMVFDRQGKARWSLLDPVRRTALTELLMGDRVQEALEANEKAAFDKTDPVQRMLVAVLTGSLRPLEELRQEDLTALQQVAPWLEGLPLDTPFPPAHEIRLRLEQEQLLNPFRHLIGRWEDGKFVEHFRGRERTLSVLRAYVDVADPESALESVGRAAQRAVREFFSLHERPPLVLHGPGGVGKSTVLAKFLLQHFEAYEEYRFPFVYIDLDRPDVSVADPRSLLAELARQLAVQYMGGEEPLMKYHRELRDEMALSESADVSSPIDEFEDLYGWLGEGDRPLVFVLDTLEVVQQRSRDRVRDLFEFLNRLQEAVPRLRAVLAGRAPVASRDVGFAVDNWELKNLDAEAARGYLFSRGIRDEQTASEIVALVGRQPLALNLAADLVQEHGIAEIRDVATASRGLNRLRSLWDKTDVTARLYERLLLHVNDPEVRKLAHPGLLLRFITEDIILRVLAKPCDLRLEGLEGPKADEAAQDLFERLQQQVSLVSPSETGVLRHRTDVRQMMLPLILKDEAKEVQVRQIQDGAIAYYELEPGTAARAEEIYHRLLRGDSPRAVEDRWTTGLEEHLRPILDELPLRAQAFVAANIDADRPDEVWRAADLPDWERYAERRVRDSLSSSRPQAAQEVLRQRRERTSHSRLLALQALVSDALGDKEAAHTQARKALDDYKAADVHLALIKELQELFES